MRQEPDDELDDEVEPKPLWKRRNVQIIGAVVIGVLVFIFTRGEVVQKKKDDEKSADSFIGVVVPHQSWADTPEPPKAVTKVAEAPPPVQPPPPATPTPTPTPPPPAAPVPPDMRRMMMNGSTEPQNPRPAMVSYAVPHTDGPAPGAPVAPTPEDETRIAFKTASIPGFKASPAIDETYQLNPGLIPCVLDTAINSDLPGPLLCHTPGPIYSRKGTLLMEAETQIIGRYESVKNGQTRLMAMSTFAHTPNGVWLPLTDTGMSDDLGRNGLPGALDQHFAQRFGAAIMMTMSESVLGIIQASVSKGGNTYLSLNGGGGGVGTIVQQILQAQANQGPTLTKNQGETIAIFLDKPADFSASYRVKAVSK